MPGALPFAWVAFSRALWTLGFIFELPSETPAAKLFWDRLQWFAGIIGLVAFYAMVIDFTGIRIGRFRMLRSLLLIVPVAFLLLLFTDDWHHLIYPADLRVVPGEFFSILTYSLTPVVLFIGIYGTATLLIFIGS